MPASVRVGRTLAWAVVGLMALRAGLTALTGDQLSGTSVDGGESVRLAGLALVLLLVLGGILLVCAWRFGYGDNWARILTVVVGVVCVLGGLLGVQQDNPAWFTGLNLAIGAVAAGLLAALFRRDANAWFADA